MDGQDEVTNKQHEQEQEQEQPQEQPQQEQEQQEEGGSASQTIIKGKRTKRQRPQSPIPFRMIIPPYPLNHNNSHNSSPTKSDHGSDICSSNNNDDNNHIGQNSSNFIKVNNVDHDLTLSTATTTTTTTTVTQEEEDIANCLILLAQGQAREPLYIPPQPRQPILTTVLQEQRQDGNNNNVGVKFTSRKFMEVTTAGKSGGYYVYECKTCSKTFPSFQALGGHRASHKKPKMAYPNTIRNNSSFFTDDDVYDPPFKTSSSSLSLQLNNKALMIYGNGGGGGNGSQHQSRPRVHECAICGAEFSSGQALGGHMRRHRGAVITAAPPPLAAVAAEQAEPMPMGLINMPTTNSTLSLDLDLNLPAPAEDVVDGHQQQHQQPEQPPATPSSPSTQQNSQQQPPPPPQQQQQPQPQQRLVLSSLALVDCHY